MRRGVRSIAFVREIGKWYAAHKRVLPWRDLRIVDDAERAYRILVSEVMLQQTQVERVKAIYRRFLKTFPTWRSLMRASNREVLLAWRGMGYNSRALRLRDAARLIVDRSGIVSSPSKTKNQKRKTKNRSASLAFPVSFRDLQSIPGIGRYTAAAILNFAFDVPTPCLDTNIRRILHRVFFSAEEREGEWREGDRRLLSVAGELLAAETSLAPSDWHAALMDFGSLVCTKRRPYCAACPMAKKGLCKAAFKVPAQIEVRGSKLREPGRTVGSRFIPNRIFRGKVVEALRDAPHGLSFGAIGQRVCTDWSVRQHARWLKGVLRSLKRDALIAEQAGQYVLAG